MKSVLWRVAKGLSCIENAWCLKVKPTQRNTLEDFNFMQHRCDILKSAAKIY